MILRLLLVLVASFAAAASATAAGQAAQAYPFRIDTRAAGKEYRLVAVNGGPATITLSAQIKGDNLASDRNWPLVEVIRPNSSQEIARVFAAVRGDSFRFTTRYSHAFGDVRTKHDAGAAYRLPFADGIRAPVGQAHGGDITTHTGRDSLYAVDFSVPEKTPVVAARGGTVVEVKDWFSVGGQSPDLLDKANVVTVQHGDGTTALYVHLALNGAVVKPGQVVTRGQLLGYSGNTGYSSGAHLHFAVTQAAVYPDGTVHRESIPVEFFAFDPPIRFEARQNMIVAADYSHPGRLEYPPTRRELEVALVPPPAPIAIDESGSAADAGITIEAEKEGSWAKEIEQQTGYPWWAWAGAFIGVLVILRLLFAFKETLRPQEDSGQAGGG